MENQKRELDNTDGKLKGEAIQIDNDIKQTETEIENLKKQQAGDDKSGDIKDKTSEN